MVNVYDVFESNEDKIEELNELIALDNKQKRNAQKNLSKVSKEQMSLGLIIDLMETLDFTLPELKKKNLGVWSEIALKVALYGNDAKFASKAQVDAKCNRWKYELKCFNNNASHLFDVYYTQAQALKVFETKLIEDVITHYVFMKDGEVYQVNVKTILENLDEKWFKPNKEKYRTDLSQNFATSLIKTNKAKNITDKVTTLFE